MDRVLPDRALYNAHQAVRLTGPLDAAALQVCLAASVRRHEALRTTFPATGDAEQIVHEELAPDFAVVEVPETVDVSESADVPDAETGSWRAVQRLAEAEVRRPFDLAEGPLFRIRVYRITATDHLLLLVLHHVVTDGWSFDLLLEELAVGYPAAGGGLPGVVESFDRELGPLRAQYGDYTAWLRQREADGTLAAGLDYWRGLLADIPQTLDLPMDRPRPASLSYRGGLARHTLPPALGEAVRACARQHGVSLFTLLLTGYKVLLHRYSGQRAFNVGTVVAGRSFTETQRMVGLFANTVALPATIGPDDTFAGLLHREHTLLLRAMERQEIAFGQVIDALRPQRDPARNPLFQAFFLHRDPSHGTWRLPGLDVRPAEFDGGLTKFDLSLSTADDGVDIDVHLAYMSELFDPRTAERLLRHYAYLLSGLVAAPDAPVADCDPLPAVEREALLAASSGAVLPRPAVTLVELLEQAAAQHPDAVAVSLGQARLTYAELHARADALARKLLACGAAPDQPVGICLERSPDLLVAVLAVLRSGAAYLPLDPGYPAARLSYMLADSGARILLGTSGQADVIPDFDGARLAVAEAVEQESAEQESAERAAGQAPDPAHLAYVIYTSGSTGRPKGVQISHESIVNRLLWMQEEYGLTPSDRVLQKTPVSFDVSTWELFWPLMTGAELVLAAPGGHLNPRYLAGLIRQRRITVCHFVPSLLGTFLEEPSSTGCDSLRLVVCSGEALVPELARQALGALPGARLENLYGPTEATVDVTSWHCAPDGPHDTVPIGRAIANTRCLVLDERMRPVPPGVVGELFLGGTGLARGYLGRPALTAERFVPDPWSTEKGARLYRTGDTARVRPDGVIDYCGRTDAQIKVNGVRVELGEIESRLRELPGVRDAVVVQHRDGTGRSRLVAHVVLRTQDPAGPEGLRDALAQQLPRALVPSAFVCHGELPRSPAGKADRTALAGLAPELPSSRRESSPQYATATEAALAGIWSGVLGSGPLGPTDNFFEAGGDSLMAITCCTRMAQAGFEVEPQLFLRLQTVRQVAEHIDRDTPRKEMA